MSATQSEIVETCVALLQNATRMRIALDSLSEPWSSLTGSDATAISDGLRKGKGGSASWKLGAFELAAQARLGIDSPVCSQMLAGSVETDVSTSRVKLSDFIAPRFEAEIGIVFEGTLVYVVPCVEIADSRFENWKLPKFGTIIDLGLQSKLFFGPKTQTPSEVKVIVRHDDQQVRVGGGSVRDAMNCTETIPPAEPKRYVATGSITPLSAMARGTWEFDFGTFGQINIEVE